MTAEEHRKFLGQDFDDVKIEELKDISKIRIDRGKTVEEKKETVPWESRQPLPCKGWLYDGQDTVCK